MKSHISTERIKSLTEFLQRNDLTITNFELLNLALIHGSYKASTKANNERLEFFGDAVLKLCISEYLMDNYKSYNEGQMSNLRAYVVSEKVLLGVASKLKIKDYILTGKSESKNISKSIVGDSVEALLAVIYYEQGLSSVKDFIFKYWKDAIHQADLNKDKGNFKAVLQEFTQSKDMGLPVYKTIREVGPDHKKEFEVAVYVNGEEVARGIGQSKKEASQEAAKAAIIKVQSNLSKK